MSKKDFGCVQLNLLRIIEEKGYSKNKICQKAEMSRTQLNNYCNGKIQRIDFAILARLCHTLECSVSDLITYLPPQT